MSGASVEVWEHREIQASAVDVDDEGELLVLAGKRVVGILPTSGAGRVVGKAVRSSRWDVSHVRWAPAQKRLALASGRRVEIYGVSASGGVQAELSWNGGPRSVTDVDWNPRETNSLVTASVDDAINVWCLRDLRKPAISLKVVSGASQARWAPCLEHILATAHDGDVKVWDVRKPAAPLQYIPAHLAKILGLAWSPVDEMCFVSASQDKTIKLWDFGAPAKPRHQAQLLSPAWKLRFSPLGNGWATIGLPKVGGVDSSGITIWRYQESPDVAGAGGERSNTSGDGSSSAIRMCESLTGHSELVMDAAWAPLASAGPLASSLALFSVGRDHSLRKWLLSPALTSLATPLLFDEEAAEAGATDSSQDSSGEDLGDLPDDLPSTLSTGLRLDTSRGGGSSQANGVGGLLVNGGAGSGVGLLSTSERPNDRLPDVLASPQASSSRLMSAPSMGASPHLSLSSGYLDPRVPFPKTSGATFTRGGRLVCFGRTQVAWQGVFPPQRISAARRLGLGSSTEESGRSSDAPRLTPRSLAEGMRAATTEQRSGRVRTSSIASLKAFYFPPHAPEMRSKAAGGVRLNDVHVYEASGLIPVSRDLARLYRLPQGDGDYLAVAQLNEAAAASVGRADLAQVWHLVGLTLQSLSSPGKSLEAPWPAHPFGRALTESLCAKALAHGDFQTAAVIGCVLGQRARFVFPSPWEGAQSTQGSGSSPYATVHVGPGEAERKPPAPFHASSGSGGGVGGASNWLTNFIAASATAHRPRSSSVDESTPLPLVIPASPLSPSKSALSSPAAPAGPGPSPSDLLSPHLAQRLQTAREAYADVLYAWGMEASAAAVLKYSAVPPKESSGPEWVTLCGSCGCEGGRAECAGCRRPAFTCALCRAYVRGLTWACVGCGHGGHSEHMEGWFAAGHDLCPANCGCHCLHYLP